MLEFLILGTKKDIHVKVVLQKLQEKGVNVDVLDYLDKDSLEFSLSEEGKYEFKINNNYLSKKTFIWNRLKLIDGSPFYFNDELKHIAKLRETQWIAFYKMIIQFNQKRVINSYKKNNGSDMKLVQQYIASQVGLLTPASLITNKKNAVISFQEKHHELITKTINPINFDGENGDPFFFWTMRVEKNDIMNATQKSFNYFPHYFQKNIDKQYELRVFVIEKKIFAFKVDSQSHEYYATDWRRGNTKLEFIPYDIKNQIKTSILLYMKHFSLFSGSFDFIVDNDNKYWFLECNIEGQWAWLDDLADGAISDEHVNSFIKKVKSLNFSN